jgi:hypothetical protein
MVTLRRTGPFFDVRVTSNVCATHFFKLATISLKDILDNIFGAFYESSHLLSVSRSNCEREARGPHLPDR